MKRPCVGIDLISGIKTDTAARGTAGARGLISSHSRT